MVVASSVSDFFYFRFPYKLLYSKFTDINQIGLEHVVLTLEGFPENIWESAEPYEDENQIHFLKIRNDFWMSPILKVYNVNEYLGRFGSVKHDEAYMAWFISHGICWNELMLNIDYDFAEALSRKLERTSYVDSYIGAFYDRKYLKEFYGFCE